MTSTRSRTRAIATLGLIACLALAACSGKAKSVGSSAAPASTATSSVDQASTATSSADPGGPATSAAVAGGDACSLITESDVTSVLGADPGPGASFVGGHGASQCHYGTGETTLVLVNLVPSQGKAAYDLMRDNPKIADGEAVVADVPGLGDRAVSISSPHGTAGIYVNKGDALLLVMVEIRGATSVPNAQTLALTTTALSRI